MKFANLAQSAGWFRQMAWVLPVVLAVGRLAGWAPNAWADSPAPAEAPAVRVVFDEHCPLSRFASQEILQVLAEVGVEAGHASPGSLGEALGRVAPQHAEPTPVRAAANDSPAGPAPAGTAASTGMCDAESPAAEPEETLWIVLADQQAADTPQVKLLKQCGVGPPKLGWQCYWIKPVEPKPARTGVAARVVAVVGGDPLGTMYGGLELAEQIRLGGLQGIRAVEGKPFILRRGIKFNIPLDARTPSYDDTGDAAQTNYVHMWEFDFWQRFLDQMARHRYNVLTLWNPHPFPSLVRLPNYPDVALDDVCVTTLDPATLRAPQFVDPRVFDHLKVVKRMSIEEKIEFWRRVMRHARNRGIEIYFITWNVLTNGTQGKYGITDEQDNPRTIEYLRECTRELILTYPDLTGIGVTAGEHMQHRSDQFDKEKWLWATYGRGVLEAKQRQPDRKVRFIHRVWQTGVGPVWRDFGSKYPDDFELSFKYARAHMYSSPSPPFARGLCEELRQEGLKCWWNMRNDDIFCFRWGDPDYARQFLRNLPQGVTAGYHMGSDGYVWGVEFAGRRPDRPRKLEIEKHWYKFMLWGRLGYDPALDRRFFVQTIAQRFPEAPAEKLYDAWQTASKIVPQVNRFHWRNWDFMWAVEGCFDRQRFHTVEDFIDVPPMEESGIVSIPEFVERHSAGEPIEGITPLQVIDNLEHWAAGALQQVDAIRREVPRPGKELRETLTDIESMAHLGNYYAAKIRGAVELCRFRRSGNAKEKLAAVAALSEAVQHWRKYARSAGSQYRPQLLARTRRLDWWALLDEVQRDVEIARNATPGHASGDQQPFADSRKDAGR